METMPEPKEQPQARSSLLLKRYSGSFADFREVIKEAIREIEKNGKTCANSQKGK
jgi:hypothetical protein